MSGPEGPERDHQSRSWVGAIDDPEELRNAFAGPPAPQYRPIPLWWWSGETLDPERLSWQLERIAELGCGAWCVTGLALYGPAAGSRADDPPGFSDDWLKLFLEICEQSRDLGLRVISWSPLQISGNTTANAIAATDASLRGRVLVHGKAEAFGLDYGNPRAIAALAGPSTATGRYLDAISDLLGDVIVGMFEDEFPLFPPWAPGFTEEFEAVKGYEPPEDVFERDHGPRTPAMRCDVFDVATRRVVGAYTAWQRALVERHGLLAGYDQMTRRGDPLVASMCYLDPFATMAWATAPGTDQMGDARFHLSVADLTGARRVWLEGFHSHGWGFTLADQFRMLYEWGREGANLFLPHGFYYTTQAFWWEWAPPEMGWRQPYARHYPAFAAAVGRLMTVLAAGHHVPEVVVLYPLTTVWASTTGHRTWAPEAHRAANCYLDLMGLHDAPSGSEPSLFAHQSLLADAGYDRVTVDEAHVDRWPDLPIIIPACVCLRTETVQTLVAQARAGRRIVFVGERPRWSAENGRDDLAFDVLVAELESLAVGVESPQEALDHLPPPQAQGARAQWRRVGDLDVVVLTLAGATQPDAEGPVRLRGFAERKPERWDPITGLISDVAATTDGDDLLVHPVADDGMIVALPTGEPEGAPQPDSYEEIALPERWTCRYLPWAENRWGDYVLPGNPGDPPVHRRTFAHREGDDVAWRNAPVTPEDHEHAFVSLGFQDRMKGRTGRPAPQERMLADGWREVVATFGPRARTVDGRLLEYSERYGVEEVVASTQLGLRGRIEPVKADLGEGGAGRVLTHVCVPSDVDTHLVIEGTGVFAVTLDGEHLVGHTEGGVLSLPVSLSAGWHSLSIEAQPREVAVGDPRGYVARPRTRLAWVLAAPYERDPVSVWGGPFVHPDYKGSPGPRRFRRRVRLPEAATVRAKAWGSAAVRLHVPGRLPAGEHVIEAEVEGALGTPSFLAVLEFQMTAGTLRIGTDKLWETCAEDGVWQAVFPIGGVFAPPPEVSPPAVPRRHPLADVAWLEGEEAVAGQVSEQVWADNPDTPPPAWFCFTAPPGARSITLPIEGEARAWLDGQHTAVERDRLLLREGARVALRVQPPPGRRGAACFTDYPVFDLGEGTIEVGCSWHRQGLDCFSGVILHRTEVDAPRACEAVLDLGEVRGSVGVRLNGEEAGVLFCPPWQLPVELREGVNVIELEVANTLGPMTSRGIPTQFSPENQRVSGLLSRPRLLLPVR